MIYSLLDII